MLWLYLNFHSLQLDSTEADNTQAVIIVDNINMRVVQLNKPALDMGIKIDMGLAMAISMTANIKVLEYKKEIEEERLNDIANRLYKYTADICLDLPHGIYIRIDTMLRLYKNVYKYWQAITNQLSVLKLSYSYSSASSPLVAKLLALSNHNTLYENQDRAQKYLYDLPVGYLDVTHKQKEQFRRVGLNNIGQLLNIPLKALSKRFDLSVFKYLGQLSGQIKYPMALFVPTRRYQRTLELLYEISNSEILIHPIKTLLQELEEYLKNRNLVTHQLIFSLLYRYDEGLDFTIEAAGGEYRKVKWLSLIRLHLESVKLAEPVVTIRMKCSDLQSYEPRMNDIFSDKETKLETTSLLNQLVAKLGNTSVSRPIYQETINPEQVNSLTFNIHQSATSKLNNVSNLLLRPSYLQPTPTQLVEEVVIIHGPERILTSWWTDRLIYRDYFIAKNNEGQWLWIYRTSHQDWFVHGWFS
ncbi:Y-family DNA polymerase [Psychrosphaera aestuarii]|uniref:Y-family DNA polymerase n=1 Tax=Psychrosphaera aestuarii TaxID=1266052 RepID=UPI001B318BBB|nr:DNA polymerase Y family protein [Psychrosphaera aestuarii]